MCKYSGNAMSVTTDYMISLRATFALQAERLNSFCTHKTLGMLAYQSHSGTVPERRFAVY